MNIRPEQIIYETEHIIVRIAGMPHVSREDGGHVMIVPKREVGHMSELVPKEAAELVWLMSVLDKAYKNAMKRQGIEIVKMNFQENGNWAWHEAEPKPRLHVHAYGRVWGSKTQPFPEALKLPNKGDAYYDQTTRLTSDDITAIRQEVEAVIQSPEYAKEVWCK